MSSRCKKCQKVLSMNEVGLYKKMISRMAEDFSCKECLAEELECSTAYLDKKIAQFISQRCMLFDLDD